MSIFSTADALTDAGDYTFTPPAPGLYRLRAVATDDAGNVQVREQSLVVKILGDVIAPAIGFALPEDGAVITAPTDCKETA